MFDVYFGIIEDDRCEANIIYPLKDILKLVMIAVLCGMDELDKIIDYGNNKGEFLKREFNIKNIPSKSTLTRVLAMLDSKKLSLVVLAILLSLIKENPEQIMLDGKAIKTTDAMKCMEKMMNIVTAYTDTGISLGQITVDDKSNEIPAVRELIEQIDVKGKIVTADAMHCQKETAKDIIVNGGDYILQLKGNNHTTYEDVKAMFENKERNKNEYETYTTIEKSHGRIETRTCYVLNDIEYFTYYLSEWKGLKKIFAIERIIEKDGKKTKEISFYLSSKNTNAENLMRYTRKHWEIESMHHILDVSYDEDRCTLMTKQAQENLNIFRKMGVSIHKNYLKNIKKKQTVKSSMFNCLLNDTHLLEVLHSLI